MLETPCSRILAYLRTMTPSKILRPSNSYLRLKNVQDNCIISNWRFALLSCDRVGMLRTCWDFICSDGYGRSLDSCNGEAVADVASSRKKLLGKKLRHGATTMSMTLDFIQRVWRTSLTCVLVQELFDINCLSEIHRVYRYGDTLTTDYIAPRFGLFSNLVSLPNLDLARKGQCSSR